MDFEYVVGIDLGTTTTLACYMKGNSLTFVQFPGAKTMMPSVIFAKEDGRVVVGKKAVNMGVTEPRNMIRSAKTYIGDFETNKQWTCGGRTFTPTDVATEVLKEVREQLIKTLKKSSGYKDGEDIGAVITIPAYFNSNQTDETKKAGEAAGFKIIRIVTEPMAAALATIRETSLDKKVFVIDLGGGTFDMSVLEDDPKKHVYRAIATGGDKRLGGDDFDKALCDYCRKIIEDDTGLDLSSHKTAGMDESDYLCAMNNILTAARKAKEDLSEENETDLSIGNLLSVNGNNYNLDITWSMNSMTFARESSPA